MKIPLVLFGIVVVSFVVMGGARSCTAVIETSTGENILHGGIVQ